MVSWDFGFFELINLNGRFCLTAKRTILLLYQLNLALASEFIISKLTLYKLFLFNWLLNVDVINYGYIEANLSG